MKIWQLLRRFSRPVIFLASVAVLAAVVLGLASFESPGPQNGSAGEPTERARAVTVVTSSAGAHAARIVGLAEVRPRWSSILRALVDGALLEVSADLQPGARVAAGQVLATIDPTAWMANLAEAENRLELAELNLLREHQEAVEARESWRESGIAGDPASSLVLRKPQIDAAEEEVEAARAARDWAARQLEYTKIRAPFTGIVASRHVSRGESILQGEPVAVIFATDVFELALRVSETQWRALADPVIGTVAELAEPEGSGRWRATVARVDGSIDPTTRMRTLHLAVADPLAGGSPLLPGSFVRVHLGGRRVEGALELPEGALTRSGHIWYVDADDKLRRFSATPLFTRPGRIYVPEPSPAPSWRIVRYPLDSFMVGQAVQPMVDGGGASEES